MAKEPDESTAAVSQYGPDADYYVVHDGGAGDGMIEAGPFRQITEAIKEKNRLIRKSHFICEFRVQQVLEDD